MTQYLLSVHHTGDYPTPAEAEAQRMFAAVEAFNNELQQTGAWVFAGGLMPRESATLVDASKSEDVLVTDGPYSESKEQLGGFWVINAADLDVALAIAKKGSVACGAPIEVRPFQGE